MYLDGVRHHHVKSDPWVRSQPFPEISNCTHCPFHSEAEHRRQHQLYPEAAPYWIALEKKTGATFLKGRTLKEILEGSTPLFDENSEETEPCACTD
jgi:hypothetical protein